MSNRGGGMAFTDPESTPPRRSFSPVGGSKSGYGGTFSDDAWYEGSGEGSPAQQQSGSFVPPAAGGYGGYAQSAAPNAFFPPFGGTTGVTSTFSPDDTEDYDNEPPLLEELGINFDHIYTKTQAVINLRKVLLIPFALIKPLYLQ